MLSRHHILATVNFDSLSDSVLLSVSEAAAVLGMAESSLNHARVRDVDGFPPYVRLGTKCIRYRTGDLRQYIASRVNAPAGFTRAKKATETLNETTPA